MDRITSYLGLAMRAGKLASGDENVLKAIRSGKAKLVLIAADASVNTKGKFRDKCQSYDTPYMEYGTREMLGASIGKSARAVISIQEKGFADMILKWQNSANKR